ncbi:MAG: hypothetical protein P4L33_16735 [Capsulimonadaceae bacterium]|nr:hypothetical protein [Capsulimonadaceae bacterium]
MGIKIIGAGPKMRASGTLHFVRPAWTFYYTGTGVGAYTGPCGPFMDISESDSLPSNGVYTNTAFESIIGAGPDGNPTFEQLTAYLSDHNIDAVEESRPSYTDSARAIAGPFSAYPVYKPAIWVSSLLPGNSFGSKGTIYDVTYGISFYGPPGAAWLENNGFPSTAWKYYPAEVGAQVTIKWTWGSAGGFYVASGMPDGKVFSYSPISYSVYNSLVDISVPFSIAVSYETHLDYGQAGVLPSSISLQCGGFSLNLPNGWRDIYTTTGPGFDEVVFPVYLDFSVDDNAVLRISTDGDPADSEGAVFLAQTLGRVNEVSGVTMSVDGFVCSGPPYAQFVDERTTPAYPWLGQPATNYNSVLTISATGIRAEISQGGTQTMAPPADSGWSWPSTGYHAWISPVLDPLLTLDDKMWDGHPVSCGAMQAWIQNINHPKQYVYNSTMTDGSTLGGFGGGFAAGYYYSYSYNGYNIVSPWGSPAIYQVGARPMLPVSLNGIGTGAFYRAATVSGNATISGASLNSGVTLKKGLAVTGTVSGTVKDAVTGASMGTVAGTITGSITSLITDAHGHTTGAMCSLNITLSEAINGILYVQPSAVYIGSVATTGIPVTGVVSREVTGTLSGTLTGPFAATFSVPLTGVSTSDNSLPYFVPQGLLTGNIAYDGIPYGNATFTKTVVPPVNVGLDSSKNVTTANAYATNVFGYRYLKVTGSGGIAQLQFTPGGTNWPSTWVYAAPSTTGSSPHLTYNIDMTSGEYVIDLCHAIEGTHDAGLGTLGMVSLLVAGSTPVKVATLTPIVLYGSEVVCEGTPTDNPNYTIPAPTKLEILCDGKLVERIYNLSKETISGLNSLLMNYTVSYAQDSGWTEMLSGTPSPVFSDSAPLICDGRFPTRSSVPSLWMGSKTYRVRATLPMLEIFGSYVHNPLLGPVICRFIHGDGQQGFMWGSARTGSASPAPASIEVQNADGSWQAQSTTSPVLSATGIPNFYRFVGMPLAGALQIAMSKTRTTTQFFTLLSELDFPWSDYTTVADAGLPQAMAISRATGRIWIAGVDENGQLTATPHRGCDLVQDGEARPLNRDGSSPALLIDDDTATYEIVYINDAGLVVRARSVDQFKTLGTEMQVFQLDGTAPVALLDRSSGITYYYQIVAAADGGTEDIWGRRLARDNSTWLAWSDGSLEKALTGLTGLAPEGTESVILDEFGTSRNLVLLHGNDLYQSAGGSGMPMGESWTVVPAASGD